MLVGVIVQSDRLFAAIGHAQFPCEKIIRDDSAAHAFAEFDLHVELRRLLWGGVIVLLLLACVLEAAGGR